MVAKLNPMNGLENQLLDMLASMKTYRHHLKQASRRPGQCGPTRYLPLLSLAAGTPECLRRPRNGTKPDERI